MQPDIRKIPCHLWLSSLLLLLTFTQTAVSGTLSQVGYDRWVTVEKVYDGDTFRTTNGEKVRLLGINTPEIAHNSQRGEPLASEAERLLQSLIGGQQVRLQFDTERRDQYGRLLAQVFLRDGRWVNAQLIEAGMAHVYTFAPNFKWAKKLLTAERIARQQQRGLWNNAYFEILDAKRVGRSQIGRFRLVQGKAESVDPKSGAFKMGKLHISIPRKYRQWFKKSPNIQAGQQWLVRGRIRISSSGKLYLALHSPFDLEKMN